MAFREELEAAERDLLVTLFYPEILSEKAFAIPRYETLNIHPGAVPEYAGKNPAYWAVAEGAPVPSVTIHVITTDGDAGTIVTESSIVVGGKRSLDQTYAGLAEAAGFR